MAKKKVKTGEQDLLPAVIERKDVTVHISLKIEADLLDAIRELAEKEHLPYQTLMKQMLRGQLRTRSMSDTELEARLGPLVAKYVDEAIRKAKVG